MDGDKGDDKGDESWRPTFKGRPQQGKMCTFG